MGLIPQPNTGRNQISRQRIFKVLTVLLNVQPRRCVTLGYHLKTKEKIHGGRSTPDSTSTTTQGIHSGTPTYEGSKTETKGIC